MKEDLIFIFPKGEAIYIKQKSFERLYPKIYKIYLLNRDLGLSLLEKAYENNE